MKLFRIIVINPSQKNQKVCLKNNNNKVKSFKEIQPNDLL